MYMYIITKQLLTMPTSMGEKLEVHSYLISLSQH